MARSLEYLHAERLRLEEAQRRARVNQLASRGEFIFHGPLYERITRELARVRGRERRLQRAMASQ